MIKIGVKGIIFLMGIQSLIGKLQTQGIISGEIKINYGVLQQKVVNLVTSNEVNGIIDHLETKESDQNFNQQLEQPNKYINGYQNNNYRNEQINVQNNHVQIYHHVVQQGETLSNLGVRYGVAWQVIKRVNNIYNERSLQVGQDLVIPVHQTSAV